MRQAVGIWVLGAMLLLGAPADGAAQTRTASAPATPDPQDLALLLAAVDAAPSDKPAPSLALDWRGQHFFRSHDDVIYIPFTIGVDRVPLSSPSAVVYVRAVRRLPKAEDGKATDGKATDGKYAWEAAHAAELSGEGRITRAMALPPGTYDLVVAVKEAGVNGATPPVGVLRQELIVPSLASPELTTSSVVLARALEQLPAAPPPDTQQDHPYVFGPLKVTPASEAHFARTGELHVFFIIYGAADASGKPDVQVDLNFHLQRAEGEKYFNRALPQALNARTLAPEFDLALGHQLISRFSVPLETFQPGDYRLEITVTDKLSGRSLTNNVNFAVSAS